MSAPSTSGIRLKATFKVDFMVRRFPLVQRAGRSFFEGADGTSWRAHGARSMKGLTMARLPNLRPCCMSSVNSVSQPASMAAATISAS
jgi:hypothetical protein